MATRSSGETDRSDWRRLRMHCFGERTGVSGRGAWSEERGVRREFTQPGKPVQNAYVESFNGRLRDECLKAHWFTSLRDARRKIETWRQDYNQSGQQEKLQGKLCKSERVCRNNRAPDRIRVPRLSSNPYPAIKRPPLIENTSSCLLGGRTSLCLLAPELE
jgi:Integrase core domain